MYIKPTHKSKTTPWLVIILLSICGVFGLLFFNFLHWIIQNYGLELGQNIIATLSLTISCVLLSPVLFVFFKYRPVLFRWTLFAFTINLLLITLASQSIFPFINGTYLPNLYLLMLVSVFISMLFFVKCNSTDTKPIKAIARFLVLNGFVILLMKYLFERYYITVSDYTTLFIYIPDEVSFFLTLTTCIAGLMYLWIQSDMTSELNSKEVPTLSGFLLKIKKHELAHLGTLLIVCLVFLGFGMHHLGQFVSVDEPKWFNTRVPQLYRAIQTQSWEQTYINDKPGLLPSLLSGVTNFFIDIDDYNPLTIENYFFWWRLPILVFNFLSLFLIYYFLRKLLNKDYALITITLIALNPILIGISQIVNPDATLWNTAFLSILTFFLFLKKDQKLYIWLSGIFLGLALTSKYFASILYVIFPVSLYFEYLTTRNKSRLWSQLTTLSQLYLISIIVYSILFPATWTNITQILRGTIDANILRHGKTYVLIIYAIIFLEIAAFNGRFSKFFTLSRHKWVIGLLSFGFLSSSSFLIFNLLSNLSAYNPQDFRFTEFSQRSSEYLYYLITSGYVTLLTIPPIILIGMSIVLIYFSITALHKNNYFFEHQTIIVTFLGLIFAFLVGSTLGRYTALARYQIILYPVYIMLAVYGFRYLFPRTKLLLPVLILFTFLPLWASTPFYYLYNNFLNIPKMIVTEAWGYGGYELAQVTNQLPDAENLSIWTDREGFGNFSVSKIYWRSRSNPFDPTIDIDYLALSKGGENILRRNYKEEAENFDRNNTNFYGRLANTTPILEYYHKKPLYVFCIHNHPSNCISLVILDKNDLEPIPSQDGLIPDTL